MVEVKPIDVCCSSEDAAFPALNLVRGAQKPSDERKQWMCSAPDEKFAHVTLKYEKPFVISSLEIKNNGTAYVQVEGGNSEEPGKYKVLWRTQNLMTPGESRQGTETDGIYIFLPQDLATAEKDKTWDILKITCSQPFNKLQKYGLSHVIARSALPVKEEIPSSPSPCVAVPPSASSVPPPSCTADVPSVKTEPDDDVINAVQARKQQEKCLDPQSQMSSEVSSSGCTENLNPFSSPVKQETTTCDETYFASPGRPEPSSSIHENNEPANQQHDLQSPSIKREDSVHITTDPHSANEASIGNGSFLKRRISESDESSETNSDEVQVIKRPAPSNIIYKPFNKLLEGVKIVISGFENPSRKHIRDKAMEMGATYSPFWNETCTHLVCAFLYTPKYRQACLDNGLVVTREWIDMCHLQRKRLPWRRFALNPSDRTTDSGGLEIWEEPDSVAIPSSSSQDNIGSTTSPSTSRGLLETSSSRVICSNQSGQSSTLDRSSNNAVATHFSPSVKRELLDNGECSSDQQTGPLEISGPERPSRPSTLQHRCTPPPRQNIAVKREINNEDDICQHETNCSVEQLPSRRPQASCTPKHHHFLYSPMPASSSTIGDHETLRSAGPNTSSMEPGSDGYAGYYRPISQPCSVPHSSPSATYLVPPVIMLPQSLPQYFVPVSQQFQAPPPSRDTYMARTVPSPQVHGQHIRVIQHSNKATSEEENPKQS